MPEDESNLVLPFAVVEREGGPTEEFPFDMTLATVLADVEMQREKAGVLRKREESLEFVSLVYWPIVVAPWREDRHLVFDGMGVWSHVFSVGKIPDARGFAASLDAATDYRALLGLFQTHAAFFDDFQDTERIPVMGLFVHEDLLRDILSHAALAKPRRLRSSGLLVPRLTPEQAKNATQKMRSLLSAISESQASLTEAGQALDHSQSRARGEIAALRELSIQTYAGRLEGLRSEVTSRTAALEKERDDRWAASQSQFLEMQAAVQKSEADVQHWDVETKTNYGPDRDDAIQRLAGSRVDFDRAREQAQRFQRDMAQAREDYERQIRTQWDRIRELERERDAEAARFDQEEKAAVQLVAKLIAGVSRLTSRLDEGARFLVSQGVHATVDGLTTVRMPIMIASFVSDRGRRFVVYPPMVARTGKGVVGSLKSRFGGAVLPLEPKTARFEEIFQGGIQKAVADDPSLASYLASVGNATNVLHLANLRDLLAKGLAGLREQGWIKDKHERDLIETLEQHILLAAQTAPHATR